MRFYEHFTIYQAYKQELKRLRLKKQISNPTEYYNGICKKRIGKEDHEQKGFEVMCLVELAWYLVGRPYYKVWPEIAKSLSNLRLDISPFSLGIDGVNSILIRFADGEGPVLGSHRLVGVLGSFF